jgi:hypothetical protein
MKAFYMVAAAAMFKPAICAAHTIDARVHAMALSHAIMPERRSRRPL